MRKNGRSWGIVRGAALCVIFAGALFYEGLLSGRTANAASTAPAPEELLSALPAGAPTLVYIDLAAVRASGFYQHRPPDRGPVAMPSKDYEEFMRSTGFDFEKDLDRVAIASWGTPSATQKKLNVLIAEGRFDRAKIRGYAQRKGKLEQQEGREVYLFRGDGAAADWNSITFLDDHRIAIVAGPSVAPLYAAPAADATSDPARERASRLDDAAAFAITRMPPIPNNFGPGGAQSAAVSTLVRSIQWVTLAAHPDGDNLRVSLEGECDNDEDARQLRSTLEVLRMFIRSTLDSPNSRKSMDAATYSVLDDLLGNADIKQSEERVHVQFELTPDIFKLGKKSTQQ